MRFMGTGLTLKKSFGKAAALRACLAMGASFVLAATSGTAVAATASGSAAKHHHRARAHAVHTRTAHRAAVRTTAGHVALSRHRMRHVYYNPWTEPTFADSTTGDQTAGEDPVVRKAALDALGPYNGAIVVTDVATGRILTIVNQKLALRGAFQPCSTVKVVISLASLSEAIVNPEARVRLGRRYGMDMTRALAMSNNLYFARLGQELGFDRVEKYGKMFGLGEKAGLDIPGEQPGFLAAEPPPTGVGMMTSFGDGIRLTPLELSSIIATVANGGTMYYLQYPENQEEAQKFVPRIKRTLDIQALTNEIKPGMMAAVEYGTARRANFDPTSPIFGKTGTCTDTAQPGVHLGWFGSFNETPKNRVAVVVLLTGGRGTSGPIASGIAGNVYHNLAQAHYFDSDPPAATQANEAAQTSLLSLPAPSNP